MKKHFGSLTAFCSARLQRAPNATSNSAAFLNSGPASITVVSPLSPKPRRFVLLFPPSATALRALPQNDCGRFPPACLMQHYDQFRPERKCMKTSRLASISALCCAFTTASVDVAAQISSTTNVAMKAESWEFQPQKVEFLEYKSKSALKILPGAGPVVLKAPNFTDGTIEFDYEPLDPSFASVFFRWQNAGENECFYFRTGRAEN